MTDKPEYRLASDQDDSWPVEKPTVETLDVFNRDLHELLKKHKLLAGAVVIMDLGVKDPRVGMGQTGVQIAFAGDKLSVRFLRYVCTGKMS